MTVFKKIDASVPIIFLQNGMGHIPFIQALKQPVYIGVVEHGVLKVNDNTFIQTGKGKVEIALYNGEQNKYQTITEQLNQRDFPVVNCDDWESMLAKKLVVNAVINPLTAIFNVQNGKILSNPFIQQLAFELCSETAEVLGIDKKKSWDHVQSIAESTSYNQSSMVKDLFHHRQTEIEAITGYILNKSSKKLPYSLFVYQSVKALEYEEGIQ
ncbi:2-dehydropantoate 2-reductase [Paracerasibacillus soli]|uniref:2-dehydropantoate 2-reductase n=1 Tax=Paracerasibacillus soli TaxID=480284 RepID=A0ABU5CP16_9BACI|nr:2-dehydropantoate 2-reductase [Virgibacillus soli]MDY0408097.1 2-dehydropantoate 2-reductase [Virgibacillus soli]